MLTNSLTSLHWHVSRWVASVPCSKVRTSRWRIYIASASDARCDCSPFQCARWQNSVKSWGREVSPWLFSSATSVANLALVHCFNLPASNIAISFFPTYQCYAPLVSPASLLDSQHGCIALPHAKESGQNSVGGLVLHCQQMWLHCQQRWIKPHPTTIKSTSWSNGPVETKPPTEFDQTGETNAPL